MVAVEAAVSGHVARIAEVGGAQGLRLPEPGVAAADPTDVEDPGFRAVWVGLALTKAEFYLGLYLVWAIRAMYTAQRRRSRRLAFCIKTQERSTHAAHRTVTVCHLHSTRRHDSLHPRITVGFPEKRANRRKGNGKMRKRLSSRRFLVCRRRR